MRSSSRTVDASDQSASQGQARLKWWQIALRAAGWCLWIVVSYLLSAFAIVTIARAIQNSLRLDPLAHTAWTAALQLLQLLLLLAFVVLLPYRIGQRRHPLPGWGLQKQLRLLGLSRWPNTSDIWPLLAGVAIYYVGALLLVRLVSLVIGTGFMDQAQNVGFAATGNSWPQVMLIVLVLAIVTPLIEEIIFRGFLLGRLWQLVGFWPAAIIASSLFALAHGQLNVGLTTFVLSLVACLQRQRTGALWAGIGLHMTVNLIAATVVYILPLW